MTDAVVETCLNCATPLPTPRKLKEFCSYSCRGQHAAGVPHEPAYIGSKNTKQNRALQSLKRASVAGFSFAKINSVTNRIDRPSKKGVGWLMEVAWPGGGSRRRWVARIGNQASGPLPLEEAKQAAAEMLRKKGKAEERDWIAEVNQHAANEVDSAVLRSERRKWPIDLMGGYQRGKIDPELRRAILDTELSGPPSATEALQGDDYPLEYHEDGYPKLPACLVSRAS